MSQLRTTRRKIYDFVNTETSGKLLTSDQPLDEAADRIWETLFKLTVKIERLENEGLENYHCE